MYVTAPSSNHFIYDLHTCLTLRQIIRSSPTESFAARARAIFTARKRRKKKKIKCNRIYFLNIEIVVVFNKKKQR